MEYTNEMILVKRKKMDKLYRAVRKNKILVWCIFGITFFSIINFCLIYKFFDLLKTLG